MRTRIKICGITRPDQAQAAAHAGADAVGLVFYAPSSRALTMVQACEITLQLPAFVTTVALFLDAESETIEDIVRQVRPDLLQFHGRESVDFCRSFGLPYIKAVPMQGDADLTYYQHSYADARALLLDGHAPGEAGGQGVAFDWSNPLSENGPPLILAGGLHAGNVAEAIRNMRPYGVDVSSGVESAPGVKDNARIRAFIEAVQRADREQ